MLKQDDSSQPRPWHKNPHETQYQAYNQALTLKVFNHLGFVGKHCEHSQLPLVAMTSMTFDFQGFSFSRVPSQSFKSLTTSKRFLHHLSSVCFLAPHFKSPTLAILFDPKRIPFPLCQGDIDLIIRLHPAKDHTATPKTLQHLWVLTEVLPSTATQSNLAIRMRM